MVIYCHLFYGHLFYGYLFYSHYKEFGWESGCDLQTSHNGFLWFKMIFWQGLKRIERCAFRTSHNMEICQIFEIWQIYANFAQEGSQYFEILHYLYVQKWCFFAKTARKKRSKMTCFFWLKKWRKFYTILKNFGCFYVLGFSVKIEIEFI